MQATITLPPDLAQRIEGFAASHGKNLQQVAVEALTVIFDSMEVGEERTLRALESARRGEGRPAKEVLAEIRNLLGDLADYQATELSLRQAKEGKTRPIREFLAEVALLDVEYVADCSKEADPTVTLESVRQILTKIPSSISDNVTIERNERC